MKSFFFEGQSLEIWHLAFVLPPLMIIGTATAFATLDLEMTSAFFHYSLYLCATVVLRLIVGLTAL